jgi:hypothetical protein
MAHKLHLTLCPLLMGPRLGCRLLSWSANEPVVLQKPKRILLPILVVLFLFSYGLLAMLVTEQGHTIESQRYLIRSLFDDSNQLFHMKGDTFQKQRAQAQAQALAKDHSQAQTPSIQVPSDQTPSTQASPGDSAKNSSGSAKLHKMHPPKPPASGDFGDLRRTVLTI